MGNLKKGIAVFLVVAMMLTTMIPALAATGTSAKYAEQATKLNKLGLYLGESEGTFVPALEKTLNRESGAVLLLRLFGQEDIALAMTSDEVASALENCTDASKISGWAKNQVAYAVEKGIIKGYATASGEMEFKPQTALEGKMFSSLVLQQLGRGEEFEYSEATDVLIEVSGSSEEAAALADLANKQLTRDDLVGLMYFATLTATYADGGATVLSKLLEGGTVTSAQIKASGVEDDFALPTPTPKATPVAATTSVPAAVYGSVYNMNATLNSDGTMTISGSAANTNTVNLVIKNASNTAISTATGVAVTNGAFSFKTTEAYASGTYTYSATAVNATKTSDAVIGTVVLAPFGIASIACVNQKQVDVTFTKGVDSVTGLTKANYVFDVAAAAADGAAVDAYFPDPSNTKVVRLTLPGVGTTAILGTTDTANTLSVSNVKCANSTEIYTSPVEKQAIPVVTTDSVTPTVVSITGNDQMNFEVVYSEPVLAGVGTDNSALKALVYTIINSANVSTALSAAGTTARATVTNPSGNLRTFRVTLDATNATSVAPMAPGNISVLVNSVIAATDKIKDFGGNIVQATQKTVTITQDITKPTVTDIVLVSRTIARVSFSEAVTLSAISNIKWGLTSVYTSATNSASTAVEVGQNSYDVTFLAANAMPTSGQFYVHVPADSITDLSGNTMLSGYAKALTGTTASPVTVTTSGVTQIAAVLTFSRNIGTDSSVTTLANYKIDGVAVTSAARTSNSVVTLGFASVANGSHNLVISAVNDEFGQPMSIATISLIVSDTTAPTLATVDPQWTGDGVMVGTTAKDVIVLHFSEAMKTGTTEVGSIENPASYKFTPTGGTVAALPSGTTCTAFGSNKWVKIVMPAATFVTVATDTITLGYTSSLTYYGVSDLGGNPYGTVAVALGTNPGVAIAMANTTVSIIDSQTVAIDRTTADNAFEKVSASDFACLKNGVSTVTSTGVSLADQDSDTAYDRILLTFPSSTFTASDIVSVTLTASVNTTDAFGVNVTSGTKASTTATNKLYPEITNAVMIDSTNILITLNAPVDTGMTTQLGNDLIVVQGTKTLKGNGATLGLLTVTEDTHLANHTQFNIALFSADALDLSLPVIVKTQPQDLITTKANNTISQLKANTTGLTFNSSSQLAACDLTVEVGTGVSLTTSAFTTATGTDKIVVTFNRNLKASSIFTNGGTSEAIGLCTVSAAGVLTIPNVGTFSGVYPLGGTALAGSTFTVSMPTDKTLSMTLTTANSDLMVPGYQGITYTPASTIKSSADVAVDTGVTVSGKDASQELVLISAVAANVGTAGSFNAGDTLTLTWNGPARLVDATVVPDAVDAIPGFTANIPSADVFDLSAGVLTAAAEPAIAVSADYRTWTITLVATSTVAVTNTITPNEYIIGGHVDGWAAIDVDNVFVTASATGSALDMPVAITGAF